MSGGKGQDQLKCFRGVTRRVTQSHKVLFCTVQGNGCGPGRVFLFKTVTPDNLLLEGPANLRETVMYLHHGLALGEQTVSPPWHLTASLGWSGQ